MHENKEIEFVAKRYRPGRFNTDRAWNRLGIATSFKRKRLRIAAAAAGLVFLSATAAFVYRQYSVGSSNNIEMMEQMQTESPVYAVKVIDFENTPLPMVIDRIKDVYGVDVENIPVNAGQYRLSLHYEGNAIDLVETINDILDINMTVEE